MEEITPPEGDTAVCVPLVLQVSRCRGHESRGKRKYLLGLEEILRVGE